MNELESDGLICAPNKLYSYKFNSGIIFFHI